MFVAGEGSARVAPLWTMGSCRFAAQPRSDSLLSDLSERALVKMRLLCILSELSPSSSRAVKKMERITSLVICLHFKAALQR